MKTTTGLSIGLLSLAASGLLWAENDGMFAGLSLGVGETKFKQEINNIAVQNMQIPEHSISKNATNFGGTLKAGYKQFFGESKNVGLRYYGYVGYGYGGFGDGVLAGKKFTSHLLDYGVGVDALYNFINTQDYNIGLFAGLNLGGITWITNGEEQKPSNGSENRINFETDVNVGLRTSLAERHGIELGVKIPLTSSEIYKGSGRLDVDPSAYGVPAPISPISIDVDSTKSTIKRNPSVFVSYIYNF